MEKKEPVLEPMDLSLASEKFMPRRTNSYRVPIVVFSLLIIIGFLFLSYRAAIETGIQSIGEKLGILSIDPVAKKDIATKCYRNKDYKCTIDVLKSLEKQEKLDSKYLALIGASYLRREEYSESVQYLKTAIEKGAIGYDTYAYYGTALNKTGNHSDAVKFGSYALEQQPTLYDITNVVADSYVKMKDYSQAITLLKSYDDRLIQNNKRPIFTEKRQTAQNAMQLQSNEGAKDAIYARQRNSKGFDLPVKIGENDFSVFMVDTGASSIVFSKDFLLESKSEYKDIGPAKARIANEEIILGRKIILKKIWISSIEANDVIAFVCEKKCSNLLGMTALERFELSTETKNGLPVMKLMLK